jgi:hypothetical protein
MAKEFAIWGKAPNATEESVLLSHPGGAPITDRAKAERYMETLSRDHGCCDMRIQELDLSQTFDFARAALGR